MDFPLAFPVVLVLIIASGSLLNGVTLYILAFDKHLRKQLSSVRAFMMGETLCNLFVCALGVSLTFANIVFPTLFEQALFLCFFEPFFSFGMSAVALWYQTITALTRVAAVFVPHMYRHFVKRSFARFVLLLVPWIFSYTGFFVSIAVNAYKNDASQGLCQPVPYDSSEKSLTLFMAYLLENTTHTFFPLFLGLFCYGAIYARKLYKRFFVGKSSSSKVGPTTALKAAAPTTFVANSNTHESAPLPTVTVNTTNNILIATNVVVVRDRKIRLLASVYIVNFIFIAPCYITFGLGYFDSVSRNWPAIAGLLYITAFLAFVVNPLVYYVVSADFRQAFMRLRPCF